MTVLPRIRRIAKIVRGKAEKKWFCRDLGGMCGIASVMLHKALMEEGIAADIVCNSWHAFLEYNGYIIDITATQFDVPKAVFIKKRAKKEGEYWQCHHRFHSWEDFVAYQKKVGWPEDQIYGK